MPAVVHPANAETTRRAYLETAPGLTISTLLAADLTLLDTTRLNTPHRAFLPDTASRRFADTAKRRRRMDPTGTGVKIAYSMKTNPDVRLLQLARAHRFGIECVTQNEVRTAVAAGFPPSSITLNGPGKFWPEPSDVEVGAIFCDSMAELNTVVHGVICGRPAAQVIGVRLRPPRLGSRFGVSLNTDADIVALCKLIARLPSACELGIHFHAASNVVGRERWMDACTTMVRRAVDIERVSSRRIALLDLGGGWDPDCWLEAMQGPLSDAIAHARGSLHALGCVILEPGKALAQETMCLVTSVLDVRRGPTPEIVVDGSIAELPDTKLTRHRMLFRTRQRPSWAALPRGNASILGRLCMEEDVLSREVAIPDDLDRGDHVIFLDAGAYDVSMSYQFGNGARAHHCGFDGNSRAGHPGAR